MILLLVIACVLLWYAFAAIAIRWLPLGPMGEVLLEPMGNDADDHLSAGMIWLFSPVFLPVMIGVGMVWWVGSRLVPRKENSQ